MSKMIDITKKIAEKIQEEAGKLVGSDYYPINGLARNKSGKKYGEAKEIFQDAADRHNI